MAQTVRLNLEIDRDTLAELQLIADGEGISFGELLSRGIHAIEIYRQQRRVGRKHFGFVSDPTKLEAILVL